MSFHPLSCAALHSCMNACTSQTQPAKSKDAKVRIDENANCSIKTELYEKVVVANSDCAWMTGLVTVNKWNKLTENKKL